MRTDPRPVVGLSAYGVQARWGEVWDLPAALLPRDYTAAVQRSGAAAVLLPPQPGGAAAVPRLDGLILAGGGDIGPDRYGDPTGPHIGGVDNARDDAEAEMLDAALAAGIPVLGICRGMQVLNVARGGTLHQHLPDVVGTALHRRRNGVFDPHRVRIAPGSSLAGILGRTEADVPSYHHQAVRDLGKDVAACAWAADGVVEAVEYADAPDVIGVQWHPEMGTDPSLFDWLTERATTRAKHR